jgi:phosphatidylserine/phosphatidylglycerophosphate/cardiolipin synthase-like enzyme
MRAESERLADALAATFLADATGPAARPASASRDATPGSRRGERFPPRFDRLTTRADRVRLVLSPDNAAGELVELVSSAEEELLVAQPTVEPRGALVEAAVAAARRGVEVRLLLGGAWYLREENRRVARRLRARAAREDLPLAVRLADPRGRYGVLHVKGILVDGERAFVGSVNWNPTALHENREVGLVVADARVASYYRRVFRADWRGGDGTVPLGAAVATLLAVLVAARYLRSRLAFTGAGRPAGRRRVRPPPSSRRRRREPPPASRERT